MAMELMPLAPRARILFYLRSGVRFVVLVTPFVAVVSLLSLLVVPYQAALFGGLTVWFGLLLQTIWMPSLAFDRWGYALDDDELVIERGVLVRRVTAIPTHRVQHVDTHQGPFEQLMGLARVHVYTASGMGADGVIPGLDRAEAERLKDALIRIRGDDGV